MVDLDFGGLVICISLVNLAKNIIPARSPTLRFVYSLFALLRD
jgi:hypothetical protein